MGQAFDGRIVLITGANHGIGAATAKAFAAQGAAVYATYFRKRDEYSESHLAEARATGEGSEPLYRANQRTGLQWLVDEISLMGGRCDGCEADLAVPDNIPRLFDQCEAQLGPVDILVSNHTHDVLDTFDPVSVKDAPFSVRLTGIEIIDAHLRTNTRAFALLVAEYLRRYLKRAARQGSIVSVSTDAAHAHSAAVSYAASKHAIESYSRSAALELGKHGIRVNTVAPGPIQTGWLTARDVDTIASRTPLRRVGEPDDVADVIVFLASEQARWITGELIYVGGGWRIEH